MTRNGGKKTDTSYALFIDNPRGYETKWILNAPKRMVDLGSGMRGSLSRDEEGVSCRKICKGPPVSLGGLSFLCFLEPGPGIEPG